MPQGTLEVTIAASPDEVFAYVADLLRAPEWVDEILQVAQQTDGPVGVGSQFSALVSMAGKQGAGLLDVTAYEPGKRFAYRGKGGPATFNAEFRFEPDGQGTRLVHDYDVSLSGMAKLLAPALTGVAKSNGRKALEGLKARLEGQTAG